MSESAYCKACDRIVALPHRAGTWASEHTLERPLEGADRGAMSEPEPDTDLLMLRFFWEQKGDLSRYVGFDMVRASGRFPELFAAWDAYRDAARTIDRILEETQ